jgi:hypothetical protein
MGHDFVKVCGPGSLHLSMIPLVFEVVLLLKSGELVAKSIELGRQRHELCALKRVVRARPVMGSQCSRVEAVYEGVDGISSRRVRATKRQAGCAVSDGGAHRLNDLGHI